jgi:hypothetical protein
MENTRAVQIPEAIYEAVERRFAQQFGSVEECVVAVLKELVRDDVLEMDEREQQIVEDRLRALGYV